MIEAALIAIERLLPEECPECKEEFTTARETVPSLQCSGCSQGFHQECFVALTGSETLAKFPGSMHWLCNHCAPNYTLVTSVGPEGASKPRSKRYITQTQLIQSQNQENNSGNDNQNQGRPNESVPMIENQVDCPLLLKNECPFGLSGKKGGTCQFLHRQRCSKYMKWGDKHIRGCKEKNCPKLHPELCVRSLALECLDRNCAAKLHTRKCKRHTNKPPTSWNSGQNRAGSSNRPQGSKPNNRWPSHDQNYPNSKQSRNNSQTSRPPYHTGSHRQQQPPPPVWQGHTEEQSFPNMTVQPQLEAILQTIFKQQQELTRSALKEVVSQLGAGGPRGSCHMHSSC